MLLLYIVRLIHDMLKHGLDEVLRFVVLEWNVHNISQYAFHSNAFLHIVIKGMTGMLSSVACSSACCCHGCSKFKSDFCYLTEPLDIRQKTERERKRAHNNVCT